METLLPGYNGERSDPLSGVYHLGNGYRAYNPVLMRFTCPDALSPFGAGGINPYAYCAGDPVNHADPTGHLSWQSWLGIGMGILGLGMALLTAGSSIAAAGSVIAAAESASASSMIVGATGIVSDVTAIASGVSEGSNPKASAILGWVSLGFGAVGLVHGVRNFGQRLLSGETKSITWGWSSIRNVHALDVGAADAGGAAENDRYLYMFSDTHRGIRRLNIVGHAAFEDDLGTATFLSENGHLTGTNIAERVSNVVDLSQFGCARTIMCYSATGGANSLANQFRAATGLITTGFDGEVTTLGDLTHEAIDIFQTAGNDLNRANNSFENSVNNFFNRFVFGIVGFNPRNPGDALFRISRTHNYAPVTFFNGGIGRGAYHAANGEFGGYSLFND